MTKQDRVRVLRVLEYEGPRKWVDETLAKRSVKGCKSILATGGTAVIREATIGEVLDILMLCNDWTKSEPERRKD